MESIPTWIIDLIMAIGAFLILTLFGIIGYFLTRTINKIDSSEISLISKINNIEKTLEEKISGLEKDLNGFRLSIEKDFVSYDTYTKFEEKLRIDLRSIFEQLVTIREAIAGMGVKKKK